MTQCAKSLARLGLALFFLLSALVIAPGDGLAQPAAPKPEELVLYPDGAVDARHVPPSGPEGRGVGKLPRHFPDLELLLQHKEGLRSKGHGTPPAPEPSPEAVTPSGVGPNTVTGSSVQGLRQSESGGWYPPDTQVAAGPGHIFQAVNLEARIWTKGSSEPPTTFNLCTFFGLANCNFASDPKVRFDAVSGRWFVVVITYKGPAGTWKLAVSTSSDPTSTYLVYTIPSKSGTFPDFPALGISGDKVVLTGNAFSFSGFFQGTEFVVLNKSQLVAGTTVNGQFYGPPQGLFTIQPAHSLPYSDGTLPNNLYMAAVAFNSATSMRIWRVTGLPSPTSSASVSVVGNLTIPKLSSPPDAKQPGTSALIQTNDNALLDAVARNDSLWVSANSACTPNLDSAVRACLRFMQILTGSGVSLAQTFDVGDVGTYYYYPAVQTDGSNNLISVFSRSSASTYASVYVGGQAVGSPNTFGTPLLIKAGERWYTPNRWGDYSGAGIDPSNQSKVWVAGEYALNNGSGTSEWGTWIAEVGF